MDLSARYGSILLLVAGIVIGIVVLLLVVDYYGTKGLIIAYCVDNGFTYEERVFNGEVRGYCVFSDVKCRFVNEFSDNLLLSNIHGSPAFNTGIIDSNYSVSFSECLAVDYFRGACTSCEKQVFDCSPFSDVPYCEQDLLPVCARVRVGVVSPFSIVEKQFGNPCSACFNSKSTELVTSYTVGKCI